MIKIERTEVVGWEHAIRGMRNPLNSWDKSDSFMQHNGLPFTGTDEFIVCDNDYDLMMRLRNAGTDHRKFMRMIICYCDITAPLYWHKEMDTYRAGVEKNSCSTMHTIAKREFSPNDFSHERLKSGAVDALFRTIDELNQWRKIRCNCICNAETAATKKDREYWTREAKDAWYQLIQLLPSSYNQKRTYMISYEALANMYHARKNHKLDEWRYFCRWIETLPYSEIITGNKTEE